MKTSREISNPIASFFKKHNIIEYKSPVSNLKKTGAEITAENPGIYKITGMFYIPIRIIVTSRLSDEYVALKILAKNIKKESVEKILRNITEFDDKDDKENIESVLEISTSANKDVYSELKEANDMGAALRELMKDEIDHGIAMARDEWREEGREEGRESGVKSTVWACKKSNLSESDAVESVLYGMDVSQSEAEALVKSIGD